MSDSDEFIFQMNDITSSRSGRTSASGEQNMMDNNDGYPRIENLDESGSVMMSNNDGYPRTKKAKARPISNINSKSTLKKQKTNLYYMRRLYEVITIEKDKFNNNAKPKYGTNTMSFMEKLLYITRGNKQKETEPALKLFNIVVEFSQFLDAIYEITPLSNIDLYYIIENDFKNLSFYLSEATETEIIQNFLIGILTIY